MKAALKQGIENALGVSISRRPPSKHFYPVLAGMLTWSEDRVIFDVGANDGRTVRKLRDYLGPAPRIYSFEPVSDTFETLRRLAETDPRFEAFKAAMGAAAGQAEIQLHHLSTHNSFVIAPNGVPAAKTETVEVQTIDGTMDELGVNFVHFLKIDTEGYELEVLRGAERATRAGRIGIIQAEFHLTGDQGLQKVHEFLVTRGYEIYGIFNQSHGGADISEHWKYADRAGFDPHRLSYADAVYIYTGRSDHASRPVFF